MIVLNVGGGPTRQLPSNYDGWSQSLLDIDPSIKPDICIDAKQLKTLEAGQYDAVYCSHNLEHFYRHEVRTVLDGFKHVLKDGGRVEIHVPNILNVVRSMTQGNLDIDDVWYRITDGSPVTFHDVMYGWTSAMSSGNLYYAHKCGFTPSSIGKELWQAGFTDIRVSDMTQNIKAEATKGAE